MTATAAFTGIIKRYRGTVALDGLGLALAQALIGDPDLLGAEPAEPTLEDAYLLLLGERVLPREAAA